MPKKKKTIIIVCAVAALAALVWWLVWRKKNTISGVMERLTDLDATTKAELKARAEQIKQQYSTDPDTKFVVDSCMETFGYTKAEAFVVQAGMFMQAEGKQITVTLDQNQG